MTPTTVTQYDRTDAELQAFWLYCILVAGKNADQAMKVLNRLRVREAPNIPIIDALCAMHPTDLHNVLVVNRVGQYQRITRAIRESHGLNFRLASVENLQNVFGVGPKTARFFILHSRPKAQVAVLDTHVLAWLRRHSVDAPSTTPQNPKEYARLESLWLRLIGAYFPNLTPAEADLLIWMEESGRLDADSYAPELPSAPREEHV